MCRFNIINLIDIKALSNFLGWIPCYNGICWDVFCYYTSCSNYCSIPYFFDRRQNYCIRPNPNIIANNKIWPIQIVFFLHTPLLDCKKEDVL